MPDGEVFTSPVETGTSGEIFFAFPSVFQGQEVENVRLRFEDGAVVHAEATVGQEYLRSLLDTDSGARVLGEVAFGLNYEIDRFTRDILFDEKIGGTMHVALGGGFDEAGTENKSDLHWDRSATFAKRARSTRTASSSGRRARSSRSRSRRSSVSDPMHRRLAEVLIGYSTEVKQGDTVRIESYDTSAMPVMRETYGAALRAADIPPRTSWSRRTTRPSTRRGETISSIGSRPTSGGTSNTATSGSSSTP